MLSCSHLCLLFSECARASSTFSFSLHSWCYLIWLLPLLSHWEFSAATLSSEFFLDILLFTNAAILVFSLKPASGRYSSLKKYSYACCITYHATAVSHTKWHLLFYLVLNAICIIRRCKRRCEVMLSTPVRESLPMEEAFSEIHFSKLLNRS